MATRVKRYEDRLDRLDDLLERVEREMGPGAELEAREFLRGGMLGLGGQRMIEVIATLDTVPMPVAASASREYRSEPAGLVPPMHQMSERSMRPAAAAGGEGIYDRMLERIPQNADVFEQHSMMHGDPVTPRRLKEALELAAQLRHDSDLPAASQTTAPVVSRRSAAAEFVAAPIATAGAAANKIESTNAQDQQELEDIRRTLSRLQGTVDLLLTVRAGGTTAPAEAPGTGRDETPAAGSPPEAAVPEAAEAEQSAAAKMAAESADEAEEAFEDWQLEAYGRLLDWDFHHSDAIDALQAAARAGESARSCDVVMRAASLALLERLKFENGLGDELPDGQLVVAFVGPSGGGKTTTIARLAAQLSYRSGLRCALITLDNSRAGADAQLRAYARLLGLPCEHAHGVEEYAEALTRFEDYDLLLVDTAGISPADSGQIHELAQTLSIRPPQQTHLVLPATTRRSDAQRAHRAFAPLACNRAVITKLDETRSLGSLYAMSAEGGLPISFFTQGQHIPRGIHPATAGWAQEWALTIAAGVEV